MVEWLLLFGCRPHPVTPVPVKSTPVVSHQARRHFLMGQLALAKGELDAADRSLARAALFDHSAWILLAQADVAGARGDSLEELRLSRGALRLHPSNAAAAARVAGLSEALSFPAAGAWQTAVRLEPNWSNHAGLVRSLVAEGVDPSDALVAWGQLGPPSTAAAWERAEWRVSLGDHVGGLDDYAWVLGQDPEDGLTLKRFLRCAQVGDPTRGLTLLLELAQRHENAHLWAGVRTLADLVGDDALYSSAEEQLQ